MNPTRNLERISFEVQSTAERIESHFARLAAIGSEPDGSISRIAWSDEESAAIAYIRSEGEAFGLIGRYDPIGNLVLSTPGTHERRVLMGSHLDSVPHGGNYDGAAGIIAGLEAMRPLVAEIDKAKLGVDLVVWRGEEHTFNAVYKGSAAAFGCSETHVLHNSYDGRSLREAITSQGFDPSFIDECKPTFERAYIDSIDGYLELHIEQGVRLERRPADLAIVSSIAGDRRFLVLLEGRFDHSGATPMGSKFRNDANLALARVLVALDELANEKLAAGQEFTQTVGIINADPEIDRKHPAIHNNSVTKVSGLAYFTLDIMSADDDFMDSYSAEVLRKVWTTAKEYGVKAVVEQTDTAPGLRELDPTLRRHMLDAAEALGYDAIELPSGAGHDAVIVALNQRPGSEPIPTAMLFVPCRNGISHAREEFAEPEAVARGSNVFRDTVRKLIGLA